MKLTLELESGGHLPALGKIFYTQLQFKVFLPTLALLPFCYSTSFSVDEVSYKDQ
jgi:hypothetical protein